MGIAKTIALIQITNKMDGFEPISPCKPKQRASAATAIVFMLVATWNHSYSNPIDSEPKKEQNPAISELLESANRGSELAQLRLASAYAEGNGVEKDEKESFEWYRRAAENGSAPAQFMLGVLYQNGIGTAENTHQAFRWFRRAALQGVREAQFAIGLMHYNGNGAKKDLQEAQKWVRDSAEQGFPRAQFTLSHMYSKGHGVAKDETAALEWMRKAAEQDYAPAQVALGKNTNTAKWSDKITISLRDGSRKQQKRIWPRDNLALEYCTHVAKEYQQTTEKPLSYIRRRPNKDLSMLNFDLR